LLPLHRGKKEESFIEGIQKSSPPFEKGRPGGIYEPPFQKTKLISKFVNSEACEALAKLLKAVENRHSGQAKRDPESRIFKRFWIPVFTGMTE